MFLKSSLIGVRPLDYINMPQHDLLIESNNKSIPYSLSDLHSFTKLHPDTCMCHSSLPLEISVWLTKAQEMVRWSHQYLQVRQVFQHEYNFPMFSKSFYHSA